MKKVLFLVLAAASFTFASCGGGTQEGAGASSAEATGSEAGIDSTRNKASIPDGNTNPESAGATTAPTTSEGTTTAGASTTGQ
ncbi:hypothetical protein [Hymenobacter volaticus]|uniref:Entericidin n=1 Tax=Hymenobacter volaticus TaxID=2932254 RepID=A0ABY4G894_9BACT|nr:hypothetical protein [Hymenobacter volaticus]UOQ66982.1 hypothetical protein MUN86_03450 [Hymenobacter volaticus]